MFIYLYSQLFSLSWFLYFYYLLYYRCYSYLQLIIVYRSLLSLLESLCFVKFFIAIQLIYTLSQFSISNLIIQFIIVVIFYLLLIIVLYIHIYLLALLLFHYSLLYFIKCDYQTIKKCLLSCYFLILRFSRANFQMESTKQNQYQNPVIITTTIFRQKYI